MPESILFEHTQNPVYPKKRQALSGAFFKSKLIGMTMIIKEVVLKEISRL